MFFFANGNWTIANNLYFIEMGVEIAGQKSIHMIRGYFVVENW